MVVYHVALSFVCGADAAYSPYVSGTMVPPGSRRQNEVERAEFAAVRASKRAQPEQLANSLFPVLLPDLLYLRYTVIESFPSEMVMSENLSFSTSPVRKHRI